MPVFTQRFYRQNFLITILLAGMLGLSACGGGSGSSRSNNSPPVVTDVSITDDNGAQLVKGDVLSISYTYTDIDGDVEGLSTFQWLRNGVAIGGATAATYTITLADLGEDIAVALTPVAASGNTTGVAVASNVLSPSVDFQKLVVADFSNSLGENSLMVYDISAKSNFNGPAPLVIPFPSDMNTTKGLSYDQSNDLLLVSATAGIDEYLFIYDHFSQADNNTVPDRVLSQPIDTFTAVGASDVDVRRGLLYFMGRNLTNGTINIVNQLSTANGVINPQVEINLPDPQNDNDNNLVIDAENDRLYYVDNCLVYRYENASTATNTSPPDAVLTINGCGSLLVGASLDEDRDILYISDPGSAAIHAIDNISTLATASIDPDRTIGGVLTTIEQVREVSVNSRSDRLYASEVIGDQVLVFDDASTLDGDVAPSWTIDTISDELTNINDMLLLY